jgi:hypothetical protein
MATKHIPAGHRYLPISDRPIVDLDGRLADRALEFRACLARLAEERLCAQENGLDREVAYMADLELEVAEVRRAYDGAAVLQLARLHAAIAGFARG